MPFPFDPATYYDEEMQRLTGGQSPRFPAYKPQEEEGVLRYLGRQVLGGVGFLGNVLDTPGSVVRGLISGDPGRAFEGILDPAKRVHGREMLENAGLLSPNQEGIDWGDVAGFGVDVLTDPLTYTGLGSAALTRTGQAAKKTGQLARTFGDRVAQGQQTLARFGIPFTDVGVNVGGPGALDALNTVGQGIKTAASYVPGAATVGKAASAVGNAVAPVGRGLKAMFYAPVEGTTSPLMQKALEDMNLYARPGAEYQAHKEVLDILGKLEAAGGLKNELGVVDPYEIGNRIRDALEGKYSPLPGTPLHDAFQSFKALHAGQNASEYAMGLNAPKREFYAPHQETLGVRGDSFLGGLRGRSPVDAGHVHQLERDPIFGDLPGSNINELTSGQLGDPRFKIDAAGNRVPRTALEQAEWMRQNVLYPWEEVRGTLGRTDVSALGGEARATALRQAAEPITAKEAVELHQLGQRAGALTPAEQARLAELELKRDTQALSAADRAQWVDLGQRAGSLSPADQATFDALNARVRNLAELEKHNAILKQSGHLADLVSGLPHLDQKLPFFANNYFADALQRNLTSARATTKAQALYDLFKQPGVVLNQAGQDTVPLASAVQGLVDKGNYTTEAHNVLRNALGKTPQEYAQLHVPQEVANDLVRAVHGFTTPDALKPVVNAFDSLQNIFKTTVSSSLLPTNVPRYTRNMLQQLWGMFVGGHHDPRFGPANPLGYARPIQDANAVFRQGKVLADANTIPGLTHLTPEEATKELAKEAAAGNVFGQQRLTADAATMTPGAEHVAQQTLRMPGAKQPGFGEILKGAIPKNAEELKPWNIRGVGDRNVTQFAPAKAGRELDEAIDAMTRGASYISLRRQGFDPVAAAAEVNRVHYNYGNLSGFEKAVARRVMPFYCVPAETSQALTRDGWKTCDELQVGDEVMTYNVEGDFLEWQPCQAKHVYDHDGDLMVLKSKRHTLKFTDNHRWAVRVSKTTVARPSGTYVYPERRTVVEARDLNTSHSLIVSAEMFQEDSILTPDQARLLGWLMTDGYYRQRGDHVEAMLFQSPHKFLDEVKGVAGGNPRKPHPVSGCVTVPVTKDKVNEIRAYLDKGSLVKVVTRLSRAAAEAMYDAMYKADGNVAPSTKGAFFAKEHKGVLDAFRVLAVMLGKRTKTNPHGCYISDNRYWKVQGSERLRERHIGRVWCPTTPNGTWVMRQGDFITISGNSWTRSNLPAQLKLLLEQPGGATAQALRGINLAHEDQGFTPEYVNETLGIPLGGEGENKRFLTTLGLPFEDLKLIQTGKGSLAKDVGRTVERLMGEMSPLIKAPLELATGKQFYSGRDLGDLYGPFGDVGLDQLLMNSPLSRAYTMGRTLIDERKDPLAKLSNLVGPGRITDVNMEKAKDVAARQAVTELLQQQPGVHTFERPYVRPEDYGMLSPEAIALLRLQGTLEQKSKDQARQAQRVGVRRPQ